MRFHLKSDKILVIFLCLFASALIIILRSTQDMNVIIEFMHNKSKNFGPQNSYNQIYSKKLTNDSKWDVLKDGTVIHLGISTLTYKFSDNLINDENICRNISTKNLKLVIIVESDVSNFEKRQTIRETWALRLLQQSLKFRVVFLVGLHPNVIKTNQIQKMLIQESHIYGDIIQIAVIESFANLTLKSIFFLKWYLNYCSKASYAFKTDDDIYIHVPNLLTVIKTFKHNNSFICHENKERKIIRSYEKVSQIMESYRKSVNRIEMTNSLKKKILKYKISFSQLPGIYYPQYCSGFIYGFNLEVAQRLYQSALTIPYFQIEDVFITGFCRHKANIQLSDNKFITLRPSLTPKQAICDFNSGRVNSNEMSTQDIRELWVNVNTRGYLCPKHIERLN